MDFSFWAAHREVPGHSRQPGRHIRSAGGAEAADLINDFISNELVRDPALLPLADRAPLLDSGILDSLSLLQLVVFLEERFGVTVGAADLSPANFNSINSIGAYLRTRQQGHPAVHG